MTRTKLRVKVDTDCHELIANDPLSELCHSNLVRIGVPEFSQEEIAFARRIQQPLVEEFAAVYPLAISNKVDSLEESRTPSKGSTDVGDISWYVPTGGIRTSCMAAESPGHSWQNVACIGSTIGEKGILYGAKTLAVTALDLLEDPQLVQAAKNDWKKRMAGRKYTTLIPRGQKPPMTIR